MYKLTWKIQGLVSVNGFKCVLILPA